VLSQQGYTFKQPYLDLLALDNLEGDFDAEVLARALDDLYQ